MATVEQVYLRELKRGLSDGLVPVFAPDTSVDVGTFGAFDAGRFVPKGSVFDRGVAKDLGEPKVIQRWSWASTSGVDFGPSVKIPGPGGGELLQAELSFSRDGGVAVSYGVGEERAVRDADAFGQELRRLWFERQLPPDRYVVWRVRTAPTGSVVIAVERGAKVSVSVDAAKLAALGGVSLGLPELSVGVTLHADRGSTYVLSKDDATAGGVLTQWVGLLGLSKDDVPRVLDWFGFEDQDAVLPEGKPAHISIDDALATT